MLNALEMRNLCKSFPVTSGGAMTVFRHLRVRANSASSAGSRDVLKNISLDLAVGEWLGVVGRNGSGKTTLMRVAAGIYKPTSGTVHSKGRMAAILQLGLGFLGRLSVADNVFLYGAIMGLTRAEVRERMDAILEFAELTSLSDTEARRLSSGQQQRLSLSVAIQVDADILLLDEVLAVGDGRFKNRCYEYFENEMPASRAMLFSSHNLSEIERFCHRTLWLDEGEVVAIGKTSEIIERYDEAQRG
jgi:ABC-type polysaccharide/polyol phosphate transport system ATPase subunit